MSPEQVVAKIGPQGITKLPGFAVSNRDYEIIKAAMDLIHTGSDKGLFRLTVSVTNGDFDGYELPGHYFELIPTPPKPIINKGIIP